MTFEQWARTQCYRLTKNARGYYTSPATLAALMAWRAGSYYEQQNKKQSEGGQMSNIGWQERIRETLTYKTGQSLRPGCLASQFSRVGAESKQRR